MHDGRNALRTGNGSLVWLSGPLATGLAWAAHTASGGQSPAVLIVLALAALLGMAASIVGPRQLPAWAVLVVAGLAQQLLHLAFAAFSVSNGVALPGHGHGGAPDVPPAEPGVSGAPHTLHLMLHLHMGAALVTMAVVTQWNKLGKLNKAFPGRPRERTGKD
ncbi:hypothetical protein [Pseudarthrobacter sp. NS4]|uniref:hypothetical protein n=1 Tax=Pseudarthrobacter sp. NS4 TaxID=2973976 RepID=UPI0021627623|nr:hypothetical protein [Pseudarthrobacter sp. NS4]